MKRNIFTHVSSFNFLANGYSNYLRFFSDHTVVDVSSTGTAKEVARWLVHSYGNSGKYVIKDDHISFSCTSGAEIVKYECVLTQDCMELNVHSLINGHRSKNRYIFIPLEQLERNSLTEQTEESSHQETVAPSSKKNGFTLGAE